MSHLGYQCLDDWYNVTLDNIQKNGGSGLLSDYYNDSPSSALQIIYPEHKWELVRFRYKPSQLWNKNHTQRTLFLGSTTTPQGFWKSVDNHKDFFDWPKSKLGYHCMDDWYNVTKEDIYKNGGSRLLSGYYNSSPSSALQSIYPEHKWELDKFKHKPSQLQNRVTE